MFVLCFFLFWGGGWKFESVKCFAFQCVVFKIAFPYMCFHYNSISLNPAPSIDEPITDYMNNFLEAMMLLEKSENEKKVKLWSI